MKTEEGEEKKRIDAIKAPLSKMIDAIKIDEKNAENNTSLHLYEFSEGAGKLYKTGFGGLGGLECDEEHILIKDENARKEAKEWVEKDLSAAGRNRPTWLYTSIDQVLTDARKLQEADPNKPISFMVISDGADSQKKGKFKNMAAVLKKHGKIFNNLENKYFIELVGFNNEGKEAWAEAEGTVLPPKGMKELATVAKKLVVKKEVLPTFPQLDFDILPGEEIWATEKEGIEVEFHNKTTCEFDGKKVDPADFKCKWKMEQFSRGKWRGYEDSDKYTPDAELYEEGKYRITLTVSHPKIEKDFDKTKELTVKQFKKPEIAGDLGAQKTTAGKETVITFDKYPVGIAGIKGSTYIIKHGDGEMTKGNDVPEKVRHTYKEAKDYKTIIILTLPGGKSIDIPGPEIAVKSPTGKIFASKDNPWIGEKVKFESLTSIPDGVTAKYTWDLDDDVVKEGKVVEAHIYKTSGQKDVVLTIKRSDLEAPVVAKVQIDVKGIDVQIGVGP
ncbi:PKD domain-containing protein [Verrucomicrobia bacterium]|nr:PKD domain-containing protein [Verrucomicrobiota bacterium]